MKSLVILSMFVTSAAFAKTAPVVCYESAKTLSGPAFSKLTAPETSRVAALLCSGAQEEAANAPVECFKNSWPLSVVGFSNKTTPESRTVLVALCAGTTSSAEPVKCFTSALSGTGLKLNIQSATSLCGGTSNSENTIACYEEAAGGRGLGLESNLAISLCRSK